MTCKTVFVHMLSISRFFYHAGVANLGCPLFSLITDCPGRDDESLTMCKIIMGGTSIYVKATDSSRTNEAKFDNS